MKQAIVDFGLRASSLTLYGKDLYRYMVFVGDKFPTGLTEYAETIVTYNPHGKAVWSKKLGRLGGEELTDEENNELLFQIMKSEIWRKPF